MLFGSTVLEVAIGIVFIYLLLSLLCSAINEYIESHLNYRATNLKKGIELLLTGAVKDIEVVKRDSATPAPENAPALNPEGTNRKEVLDAAHAELVQRFYNHGLIKSLYRDATTLPSYIPARTFALTLWSMAGGSEGGDSTVPDNIKLDKLKEVIKANLPQELQQSLITLIDDAQGDFERARKNVENWYDSAMDRVSGWYKRRVQVILLVIGCVASVLINADTVNIAKALFQDSALRSALVATAENYELPVADQPDATPPTPEQKTAAAKQKMQDVRAQLFDLGLPLGWAFDKSFQSDPRGVPQKGDPASSVIVWLILKVLGLGLTGLAISQGAPFWFDILNKFMVIRSTVKPREKSQEEKSKDATGSDTPPQKQGNKT